MKTRGIKNKLTELLACPHCKGPIKIQENGSLRCTPCSEKYSVRFGIPIMVDLSDMPTHLQGQVRYFKASADIYGTARAVEPWQDKYMSRLSRQLSTYSHIIFVDNACGSGYMSLDALRRGARVIACDLNLSGLVRLKRQVERLGYKDSFLAVCCTSESLPIQSACADVVVSNAILEHLPKEKEAIADITRITKKNGIAMVTVPLAYHLLNPIFIPVNYFYDKQIGHLRRYTIEVLTDRFIHWKVLNVYYTGHTAKVIKTLVNMVRHVFDEQRMEDEDERNDKDKRFASNISIIFKRLP